MSQTQTGPATEWRMMSTGSGEMRVYEGRAEENIDAAVIVLQEAFGVNDHIESVTRRIASMGILPLLPTSLTAAVPVCSNTTSTSRQCH
ncbi:dienelactone hydrolase [Kribbella aluminosa]|uniref:Dienelactone hydrolase n=1 Tax=Kribbella aluminosa TaxID=416017 RepID=A0ABS4UWE6_9ACTN|nr:dienelactone hydrolase family protein [Kribbella aluminosa]MBP2355951.1 dienelactone hydrolase [Kribbella aluminosa]